jgi:SAM-dependent methyltransferase
VSTAILDRRFKVDESYHQLFKSYKERGYSQALDPNDKEHNFDAAWKLPHYFETGSDALRIIVDSLVSTLTLPPRTILDLPCGSGRVTRHLKSFFPDAHIVASDLYSYHVEFCSRVLGADGRLSKENFDDLDLGMKFDIIFSGSLLTHLPEQLFLSAVRFFSRSLSDRGLAIVTLQGRHAEFIQHHKYQYIQPHLFKAAEDSVLSSGFGYIDYDAQFLNKVWTNQSQYGVCLVRPHWTMRTMEADYSTRVIGYIERGWDYSQDVLIFAKPGVNDWMREGDVRTPTKGEI